VRERGFASQAVRVVCRGDQQDRGGVDSDAIDLQQARRGASHERLEFVIEALGIGFEREHAPSQRRDRELRRVHDRVAARGWTQRGGGACQTIAMDSPEPFSQLIGCGEAEVADLIQILDPYVAARSAHDQQRADRFDTTISGFRDP
jgi:hypothetical protein